MKAILMYHSVDDSGSPISIAEPAFRRHVEWLANQGPPVMSVPDLLRLPYSEPAIALTFDDAFVNFARVAWPILRGHGLPATLYVPTAHVGGSNGWGGIKAGAIPTLPLLDWDALGRLADQGVQLGSHTCTHPYLARIAVSRVREELERSAAALQANLGLSPAGLAYPYGSYDEAILAVASEVYEYAVTVELRPLRPAEDPYRLPRVDMYYLRSAGLLEAWGSTRLKWYLSARAGVRRCRTALASGSGA